MDAGSPSPLNESIEHKLAREQFYDAYMDDVPETIPILTKNLRINEEIESMLKGLDSEKPKEVTMEEEIRSLLQ